MTHPDSVVIAPLEYAVRVLLVDDQAMIGEAVRRGLSNQENIDFHFCSDPQQAIAQAVRIKPTVILQDLVMPGLDGLTGLSNRRHFDEYLELEWRRSLRDQTQLSLLMIDVDYFKSYNDSFGHVEGDEALRKVAAAIRDASARPSDLPARYGGEEFVLVLPNTSPGGARLLAEKLRQTVAALKIPHNTPTEGCGLTISIGLATMVPQAGTDCRLLISAADRGLYLAKNNGRNQVGIE